MKSPISGSFSVMKANRPYDSLRILVADDDEFMRGVIIAILQNMGHSGVVVDNGQKLLDILAQRQFDVLLVDVMMPVMDGLAAVAAIRRQESVSGRHQRIIMATAHAGPHDRERLIEAGADGYVTKPFSPDQLLRELQRVMLLV